MMPDMASILSGPHIKSLHDFGEGPIVIVEPLAVVPVRQATNTNHDAPQGREPALRIKPPGAGSFSGASA